MLHKSGFSGCSSGRPACLPDAVGSCEHVVAGDQGATAGVSPRVILEVLKGDLEEGVEGPHVSPQGPLPHHPLYPSPTPAAVLTCQGQLWGLALSPPTTRADRLGGKVGTPQLEAGGTQERKSTGEWGWHPVGEGGGGESTNFGAGKT